MDHGRLPASSRQYTGVMTSPDAATLDRLKDQLTRWATDLGFAGVGVTDIDLSAHETRLHAWLADGCHADMDYLARNVDKRLHPELLHPGTLRVVVVRMNYHPGASALLAKPEDSERGQIARYALGRDYHKVMRRRLAKLATLLSDAVSPLDHGFRVFTDSAPVLERALAVKAGHGWVGRHSLVLNRDAGSWFFLGEIFTNLPLPVDAPEDTDHCGSCKACMRVCPTDAIRDDRTIDARRCIAWLTIENKGEIPEVYRQAVGNRVFGCDDCQTFCPWNRAAPVTGEADFSPRRPLLDADLDTLFAWTEAEFLQQTEGSAIRRINYQQWQRNLAVALGNAPWSANRVAALEARLLTASELLAPHIRWALDQLERRKVDR